MAAKKITKVIKLQIPAAKATMAPPVGPALGQAGVNGQQFVVQFNDATRDQAGWVIPVVITVYDDRSFTFITKTPPASDMLKKAAGVKSGSGKPNKTKVASKSDLHISQITYAQFEKAMKIDLSDDPASARASINAQYNQYKSKLAEYGDNNVMG